MQTHQIRVARTARYFTLGQLNARTRRIWVVLHGYGQAAEFFIRKWVAFDDDTTLIVAPEALSRFYVQGVDGRVGASWMTRECRQSEIEDYLQYLNQVWQMVTAGHDLTGIHLTLLGFSQGATTACRWLAQCQPPVQRLILWAGYFAHGIADVIPPKQLTDVETFLVYGHADEYLSQLDTAQYEADFRRAVPHLRVVSFEGKHTVDPVVLKQFFE